MNIVLKSIGRALLALQLLIALVALITVSSPQLARADSQGYAFATGTATNLPTIMPGSTASNQVSVIPLWPYRGIALSWTFNASNTITANQQMWIYPTVDGTNYNTNALAILTAAANGTNTVTVTTNWSRLTLEGYQALSISTISNAAASTTSATNKGVFWSIPSL